MQERYCRTTIGGKQQLGQRIDFNQPITRQEFWRRAGSSYMAYMKLSPLYSGSYIALNLGRQAISGKINIKKEDVTLDNFSKWGGEYAKQIGTMAIGSNVVGDTHAKTAAPANVNLPTYPGP